MPPRPTGSRWQSRSWTAPLPWLGLGLCALAAAGCEEEVRHVGTRPETRALDQTGVAVGLDADRPAAQAKAKVPPKPEFIVGKRTQDIRDAATELKTGKAQVGSTRIVARDPFTLTGNAYVAIIGRTSMLNIQHAVDLYQAENGRYPKDYNEFMEVIIKANNIALPKLPYYQAYGYDEKEHKLIIMEYPDLKEQPPQ
jgi:hypothetical protein